jgi:hypothetical protein
MAKSGLHIKLEYDHLAETLRKLTAAGGNQLIKDVSLGVATDLAGYMKRYPVGNSLNRKMEWKSDKQRRWFFWAVRNDLITFPYRRSKSGGLSGGWNVKSIPGGAVVGNRMEYGIWVQSWKFQTKMHKSSSWTTDKEGIAWIQRNRRVAWHFKKAIAKLQL